MIEHNLLLILGLFLIMALLFQLSLKLKVSYPIFLVIGGLCISFIPGLPVFSIDPEIIFLLFLPPLLFEAAWYTSWKDFWDNRIRIASMGFGLVLATSVAVAYFVAGIIPGFTLAMGFLLGGIISPPDAVAATSVLKGLHMPKVGLTLLEGESLVNDAASLTIFRFALAAVLTGDFVFHDAALDFLELASMGIVVGLVIGHIIYYILKYWVKSSHITTPITIMTPYIMYLVAEQFEWSGVLAVVSGGLFLSFRANDFLNYQTRLQTKEVWATISFLLNGFVFILIGLELPVIVASLEDYSPGEAIKYALLISFIVILLRIILVYLAIIIPRLLSSRIRHNDPIRDFKLPFVIGWAGMRGVVSLASALAIPLTLHSGAAFPHRNLILFITFIVILVTLVLQGLTLPLLLKLLKIKEQTSELSVTDQIEVIRLQIAKKSVDHLDNNYAAEMKQFETIARIKEQLLRSINATERTMVQKDTKEALASVRALNKKILLEIVTLRRNELNKLHYEKSYDEEILRELQYSLDLEEARLNGQ